MRLEIFAYKENGVAPAAVKDYASSRNHLHFKDFNKKLDTGIGFWVNRF